MIDFFNEQLRHNPFFITAFVAGIVSAVVLYFKSAGREIFDWLKRRLIFSCVIYQSDPLFQDFETWFYAHYGEKYRNVEASTNDKIDQYAIHQNQGQKKKVYFRQSEGFFLIKFNGRRILVKKGREKLEHAADLRSVYFNQYHFYSIHNAGTVRKLLEQAVKFSASKALDNEIRIYTNNSYGEWQISARISAKNIDNVILRPDLKARLIRDMDNFIASEADYNRRHIFYKRGYGFEGDPGNGKTSLAFAVASYLNKDVYCLDLNSINSSSDLRGAFANLSCNSLLLIEDIDGYFHLREPVRKDSKISFSIFLNCMDGAYYKEGLVTIITTNKKESLDPALIRAGRIDMMLKVERPGQQEVNRYLSVFYNTTLQFNYYGNLSMCDIQEICLANEHNAMAAIDEISRRSMVKVTA